MPGAWPLELQVWQTGGTSSSSSSSRMPTDVCEGCRRLRKKCPKDECVLHYSLEQLYPGNKFAQGNVTTHLAKFYGRKKFLRLLQQQRGLDRPELFKSLLREAVGRDINQITGIEGLIVSGLDYLVDEAIEKVKGGVFSSPSASSDASARSCRESSVAQSGCRQISVWRPKRERDEDEDPTTPGESVEDDPPRKKSGFDLNERPQEAAAEIKLEL